MPTKKAADGQPYEIDGKRFVWHPLDDDDDRTILAPVTIPMRIKLKVLRSIGPEHSLNAEAMFAILEAIAPGQADAMDEMDVNDFQAMFNAWQREYNALTGASLGESSP